MIPAAHVRNPDKYYDRTVQEWHMNTFPDERVAIDIDLYGYCRRCYWGLYLIEAAETERKPTGVVQNLANRSGIPALLIVHKGGTIAQWRRVAPHMSQWASEPELCHYISRLQRAHYALMHDDMRVS